MKKLGFVIANDAEEYLFNYEFKDYGSRLLWTIFLKSARTFTTYQHAQSVLKKMERPDLWVLSLFETPEKYVVSTGSIHKPKWLT